MKKTIINSIKILLLLFVMSVNISPIFADSGNTATITIDPSSGVYSTNDEFNVSLIINGHGQNFSAFKSDVSTSNLSVKDIVKGNVDNWIVTPDANSLSFSGTLNNETQNLTVYSLKLKANNTGSATINITNSFVGTKNSQDVVNENLISSSNSATYQITDATGVQSIQTANASNSSTDQSDVPNQSIFTREWFWVLTFVVIVLLGFGTYYSYRKMNK